MFKSADSSTLPNNMSDNNLIVLDAIWFTPRNTILEFLPNNIIGIVAVDSGHDGQWKCYIGIAPGANEQLDAQLIARLGSPLGSKDAASAFFPALDKEKFRY